MLAAESSAGCAALHPPYELQRTQKFRFRASPSPTDAEGYAYGIETVRMNGVGDFLTLPGHAPNVWVAVNAAHGWISGTPSGRAHRSVGRFMAVERRRRRWLNVCGRSAQRSSPAFALEAGPAGRAHPLGI
jgi:hypothetical protein